MSLQSPRKNALEWIRTAVEDEADKVIKLTNAFKIPVRVYQHKIDEKNAWVAEVSTTGYLIDAQYEKEHLDENLEAILAPEVKVIHV